MSDDDKTPDYRDTVFLPKTDFPMKAGLAKKEPDILARWEETRLYERLRQKRAGRDKWILHDGPPYANGDIHIGHALNKILKDITVRMATLRGYDSPYTPGWDCHGLPIEWKIEEQYRKKKKSKDEVDPIEFRKECRDFAAKWVDVQSAQFQRLGIMGTWDQPYLTMDYDAEATIVEEFLKVATSGLLYKGAKPVMWSPVEQTALAEAEVEYQDITSTEIDVAFEIVEAPNAPELAGAHAVIWTTTPWTIPVNRALAYAEDVEYVAVEFAADGYEAAVLSHERELRGDEQTAHLPAEFIEQYRKRRFLVAADLLTEFQKRFVPANVDSVDMQEGDGLLWRVVWRGKGSDLAGAVARHPLHELHPFFAEPRPLLAGDFVTTDSGTGLVHMAPDHGEDDFRLCRTAGIDPMFVVGPDGRYQDDWPVVGGNHVYKVNALDGPVCTALREAGALLSADDNYVHSYPHSWRSKAKLIYRCTPQWFVAMDGADGAVRASTSLGMTEAEDGTDASATEQTPIIPSEVEGRASGSATLRQTALSEIDKTRFVPERGYRRLKSCLLYTSPSPRDRQKYRMPSSA